MDTPDVPHIGTLFLSTEHGSRAQTGRKPGLVGVSIAKSRALVLRKSSPPGPPLDRHSAGSEWGRRRSSVASRLDSRADRSRALPRVALRIEGGAQVRQAIPLRCSTCLPNGRTWWGAWVLVVSILTLKRRWDAPSRWTGNPTSDRSRVDTDACPLPADDVDRGSLRSPLTRSVT